MRNFFREFTFNIKINLKFARKILHYITKAENTFKKRVNPEREKHTIPKFQF